MGTLQSAFITTTGDWTVPALVSCVLITATAAGGGGGSGVGINGQGGGGGGAGEFCRNVEVTTTPGGTLAFVFGTGGAAAVDTSHKGSPGGSTTFAGFTLCGGFGGNSNNAALAGIDCGNSVGGGGNGGGPSTSGGAGSYLGPGRGLTTTGRYTSAKFFGGSGGGTGDGAGIGNGDNGAGCEWRAGGAGGVFSKGGGGGGGASVFAVGADGSSSAVAPSKPSYGAGGGGGLGGGGTSSGGGQGGDGAALITWLV